MNGRYRIIYFILALIIAVFSIKLISLQLIHGSGYREQSEKRTTKTKVIQAPRGDIMDRYGRTLVTNKMSNTIVIQKKRGQSEEDLNNLIKKLHVLADKCSYYVSTSFPLGIYDDGTLYFVFEESEDNPGAKESAWKNKYGLNENATAKEVLDFFAEKYNVNEADSVYKLKVSSTRYEMVLRDFSYTTDFTFADSIPMDMITTIKEQQGEFAGVNIVTNSTRDYRYPYTASHVLGRVGKISAEELEAMSSLGYTMTSVVGKQGIEKYAESYLKGTNGIASVEQTKDGRSLSETILQEAVPGNNVTLTIDYDLQHTAEAALYETIADVRSTATTVSDGLLCDAGAVVAVDVNTGEILALASYPTYDAATFNRNYSNLIQDSARPLFNRALAGEYAPGSTFKVLVAAAALEEGVISPWDTIQDKGVYRYYKGYTPACWIYNMYGGNHGYVNVSQAIRDSCNYFFYDVGRRLTIDKISEYAEKFGFGEVSGVEIPGEEHSGTVASVENRKKNPKISSSGKEDGTWYPGDTLQAAIGQSDTAVTPIQLASYAATIANGGTRYQLNLIKSIEDNNGKTIMETKPKVLDTVELSDETYKAITRGMRMVVTEGTGANAFKGCTVDVAAKSGSAQTGRHTNGLYIAYAPYDNPKIAVAVVVEKAGGGGDAAPVARKVIEKYFANETEYDGFYEGNILIG